MAVYTYPQSKVIDEITFRKTEGGHLYAYLQATPGSDRNILQGILRALAENDWRVTPYNLDGKPVLEVHGFKNEPGFIKFLEARGWASGASTHTGNKEKETSFKEKIRKRSLGASGAFYLIGDASFTKYGYAESSGLNTAGGMLYGAGTLSLLLGGRKDPSDLQVRHLARQLDAYLKEHGDSLPNECSLDSVVRDHKKGLIRKADDLLRRYPSELMNLFFAAAGVCIAAAAHKQMGHVITEDSESFQQVFARKRREGLKLDKGVILKKMNHYHKLESKLDIGLGTMTGLSGLFAMLVKEKKKDPDAPKKGGMDGIWEWIQQKPLAVAGVGYMVSTMCHAVSTAIAWNYADDSRRKSVPWRATFVGANIIAEILLAISSKGHGHGVKSDKSVDNTIIALAADLIVKQPAKLQPALTEHVAGFLGRPDVLAIKNEDAAKLLREQVEALRKNPWAMASAAHTAPAADTSAVPKPENIPAWQAKVAAQGTAADTPQLSV